MKEEKRVLYEVGVESYKYRDDGRITQCPFGLGLRGTCVTALKLVESYRAGKDHCLAVIA